MKCWRRKKEKDKARKCFLENGSMFLEQLIADCNGISNPIRMFSSDQISKATNHFDPMCSLPHISSYFTWYKGIIEGRSYVIKRFIHPLVGEEERAYSDIALSARVSNNHSGFLKLIGSCLEFPYPVLVFEDLEYTPLNIRGSVGSEDGPLLPWNVRLKIAKEVATAITYLHTAFPRIILHRDIKAANVFLDKNWKASLTDFSSAVTLPEGKSWVEEMVLGTMGYVDCYYMATGIVTEYSDVFSFGILMLVLLLGRPQLLPDGHSDFRTSVLDYVKDRRERGEPVEFGGDSKDMRPGQMNMFLDLALRCCDVRNEDRPKMILVAKEIKLIEQASL
ncbi:serine/threonine-protein kinase ZRK1-like [Brassica napus]|uniref:(rape) hypothetical protein n=1 Tax=Brassica napus TaxID=3708 RepID=A0A817AMI9_BRANA|nr:serine/threonine-protein kinase ZRK1-like [Brassica napus]CAF2265683.1 unnamed protein product [Brassica napus]